MSVFIKSSSRVKPDPLYYARKYIFFMKKHEALMDQAGRNLDVQPEEPKDLTRAINEAEAKRLYYLRMIPVSWSVFRTKASLEDYWDMADKVNDFWNRN